MLPAVSMGPGLGVVKLIQRKVNVEVKIVDII